MQDVRAGPTKRADAFRRCNRNIAIAYRPHRSHEYARASVGYCFVYVTYTLPADDTPYFLVCYETFRRLKQIQFVLIVY